MGLQIEPGFKLRLLTALAAMESRDGNHQAALAYLEEVRGLAEELDDRRRAPYLSTSPAPTARPATTKPRCERLLQPGHYRTAAARVEVATSRTTWRWPT